MTAAPALAPARKLQVLEYDEDPTLSSSYDNPRRIACREFIVAQDESSSESAINKGTVSVLASSSFDKANAARFGSLHWFQAQAPVKVLRELFLPIGFPNTVRDGYWEYQAYDSLQGLCSYLRGVVCNAHVLQAAGVGNAEATAISAALTWALKDGLGMMGALVFSYAASPLFDSHVKEFRLFADVINDVGLTLDMMAPWFAAADQLLLVTSAAALCKTLCGISAGATKSSITVHFATAGNMADLNAKESTQETLVSLTGMVLGVTLAKQLAALEATSVDPELAVMLQWIVFVVLTAVHVWANYKGVQLLKLETLNRERTSVVLEDLLTVLVANCPQLDNKNDVMTSSSKDASSKRRQAMQQALRSVISSLPRPVDVDESLLASVSKMLFSPSLILGARLASILQHDMEAVNEFRDEHYVLGLTPSGKLLVCLTTGATTSDQLQAFVHALLVLKWLDSLPYAVRSKKLQDQRVCRFMVHQTHEQVGMLFSVPQDATVQNTSLSLVSELMAKGWHITERLYLGFPRRRSQWHTLKTD